MPVNRRRWLVSVPSLVALLVPLAMIFTRDIRVTFAAGFCMLAVQAVIARRLGATAIVQGALWVGALGFAGALWFYGYSLRS